MAIYKTIEHRRFGEIYCVADEEGTPSYWAKKEKVNFFSDKYSEIEVQLDLYQFNKDCKAKDPVEGKENENDVIKWLSVLLGAKEEIEEALWEYYESDMKEEYDEYYDYDNMERPNLKNKEELYNYVKVEYATVHIRSYEVIVSVSWGWMNLAIYGHNASKMGDYYVDVTEAKELLPAGLDYFN